MKLPELNEGELLIGGFVDTDGKGYWCVLLAGDYERDPWQHQMAKAALVRADLLTRAELLTMYEKFPEQFQKTWYWSNTTDPDGDQWAWIQFFHNGDQSNDSKRSELRARAVRRIPME